MSKRFGRNQKRRMRNEIQLLQSLDSMSEQISKANHELIRQQAIVICRVGDILGLHFAGLPAKVMPSEFADGVVRLPAMRRTSSFSSIGGQADDLSCMLDAFEVIRPEISRDKLSKKMHVYLRNRRGDVAYALTEDAMYGIPKQHLADQIAKITADYLVGKLP